MVASAAILSYTEICAKFIYCQTLLWLFLLALCNWGKKKKEEKKEAKLVGAVFCKYTSCYLQVIQNFSELNLSHRDWFINSSIQEKQIQHLLSPNDPIIGFEGNVWLFAVFQFGKNVIMRSWSICIFIFYYPYVWHLIKLTYIIRINI